MKYHYTNAELAAAVEKSHSVQEVCEILGCDSIPGRVARDIKKLNLNAEHFRGRGWAKGVALKKEDSLRYGITLHSSRGLTYLIPERGHICESCKRETWEGLPIPLELHHINGNKLDNRRENLLVLCPNCHAQTDNYRGRNAGKREYVSDEEFIDALKECKNIRQTLLKLGLSPKGDNYRRANELIIAAGLVDKFKK